MIIPEPSSATAIARWVRAIPVVFLVYGAAFGTWLGRLPAVRDQLGASAAAMSIYGLCLALGSLVGLVLSGRLVQWLSPRRSLFFTTIIMTASLPVAAALIMYVSIPFGLIALFAFGVVFSAGDVAMNVSGANAEAAYRRPRMPLMHAGYSLGAVATTGLGALAEALQVPVPVHFAIVMLVLAVVLFWMLRFLPRDELSLRRSGEVSPTTGPIPVIDSAAGYQPAFTTMTGAIPIAPETASHAGSGTTSGPGTTAGRAFSPWRDPRVLLIGLITLSFGLFEGTAADWLPLALVDGRAMSNELGSTMLSVFFAAVMATRIAGSWLIMRFGRVSVLRGSAIVAATGIVMTILVPGPVGAITGVVAWGLGTGLGWPITISASADRAETAARSVAAVSALGYGSMLIGPLAFGFFGDHFGLLTSFWALLPFAAYALVAAGAARPRHHAT